MNTKKLNLSSKFHAEVTTHLPHLKIENTIYLEYFIIRIATQLNILLPNSRFCNNFHTKLVV